MKLINIIDFILNVDAIRIKIKSFKSNWDIVQDYAKLLKQPIKASHFIPIDDDGNVLSDMEWKCFSGTNEELRAIINKHKKAKNNIIFNNFVPIYVDGDGAVIKNTETNEIHYIKLKDDNQTIEHFIIKKGYDITKQAINLIFR